MSPFRYPEVQHSRTQNPARFSDYKRPQRLDAIASTRYLFRSSMP